MGGDDFGAFGDGFGKVLYVGFVLNVGEFVGYANAFVVAEFLTVEEVFFYAEFITPDGFDKFLWLFLNDVVLVVGAKDDGVFVGDYVGGFGIYENAKADDAEN